MLNPVNKLKAIQSAFAAQKVILNGKKAPNASEILDGDESTPATTAATAKKPKSIELKKNNRQKSNKQGYQVKSSKDKADCTNTNWNQSLTRNQSSSLKPIIRDQICTPCDGCSGLTYIFNKCYLVLGQDCDWLPNKAQEQFKNNMKAASFKR